MTTKRTVLAAPKLCGRGIEFKILSTTERDAARLRAAESVAQELTHGVTDLAQNWVDDLRFRNAALRECVMAMVVKVTKKGGYKKVDEVVALPASEWQECNSELFEEVFEKDARNETALNNLFDRMHSVTKEEIDAIVGEAVDVSED